MNNVVVELAVYFMAQAEDDDSAALYEPLGVWLRTRNADEPVIVPIELETGRPGVTRAVKTAVARAVWENAENDDVTFYAVARFRKPAGGEFFRTIIGTTEISFRRLRRRDAIER